MYKLGLILVLSLVEGRPQISLEYKPTRPFHHPKPAGSHLGQIVPTGKPWPQNQQGYQNFSQLSPGNIVDRIKETETEKGSTTSSTGGFIWQPPSEDEDLNVPSGSKQPENPTNTGTINLEYQPMRPPYHPNPGNTIGQIIPPSNPWPAKPEDYPNFTQTTSTPVVVDRIEDSVPSSTETTTSGATQEETVINIEYKPNRPFYHPKPGNTVGQVIPPGNPWPQAQETNTPVVVDRIEDSAPSSTQPPSSGANQEATVINIEYKPNRPFYHPKPGNTVGQVIPPGNPWPQAQETNTPVVVDRIEDSAPSSTQPPSSGANQEATVINIEYKPNRPFYHPKPGNTVGQVIPPGNPWPQGQETNTPVVVDRIEDSAPSSTQPPSSGANQEATAINIEYKPNRPFYHPKPGNTVSQVIPPGNPWPQGQEDYQNFTQIPSYNTGDRTSTTPSGFIWQKNKGNVASFSVQPNDLLPLEDPDNAKPVTLIDRIRNSISLNAEQTTTSGIINSDRQFDPPSPGNTTTHEGSKENKPISLEYQPNRPFYHPNPGDVLGQIIPPGKPWPSSAEGYQNFSQTGDFTTIVNRIKETTSSGVKQTTTVPTTVTIKIEEQKRPVSLEYQPNKPFHASASNLISQIVPPGKPWPASAEGYQNFSQTTAPELINRFQENTSKKPESTSTSKTIGLEYQSNRPPFHPNPGNNINQIVPPGKPWPSSPEGYQNFSQIPSPRPNLESRIKDSIASDTLTPSSVPLLNISESYQTSSVPNLIDSLQDLANKRKMQTTNEPPQSGFIWETETSSGERIYQNGQTANTTSSTTENSSTESSSVETSTIDATTKIVQSATEGKLYTSSPLLTIIDEEVILEPSAQGYTGPMVQSSPIVLLPSNWSPSHYIFYI